MAKEKLVKELRTKLDTDLDIGSLYFQPFNVIQLNDVYLNDRSGDTILNTKKVYAEFDLRSLLDNTLLISVAQLSDFQVNLAKDSTKAPLNILFIIDAFKPKEESSKNKIEVKISSLNLINGGFTYNVKNKPQSSEYRFDPNHIKVTNLNSKLSLKSLKADSLNIQIKKLSLEEKSGFILKNLITRIISVNNNFNIKNFELDLPQTHLKLDQCNIDCSAAETSAELINKALIDLKIISSSYVSLKDIAAFVPSLKNFKDPIALKTEISGKLDSLNLKYIILDYGEELHLNATAYIKNLPNIENLYVKSEITSLKSTQQEVLKIINSFSPKKNNEKKEFVNLSTFSFNGNLEGYLRDLNFLGHIKTNIGSIDTQLNIGFNVNNQIQSFFKGKVSTRNFNLGKLLKKNNIGSTSLDIRIDIKKLFNNKLGGSISGDIHQFELNSYKYNDIKIEGKYDGQKGNVIANINDENGIANINGSFDMSKKEPEYRLNAHLKNIRLDNLKLSNKYAQSYLSLNVNADLAGKNIDNISGYLDVDSISFLYSGKRFFMDSFLVNTSKEDSTKGRVLTIKSELINGEIKGNYAFSKIGQSLKLLANNYLPALVPIKINSKLGSSIKENDLTFDFTINNTQNLSDILNLPITIYSPSKIIGFYNNKVQKFKFEGYFPSLNAAGSRMQSGYVLLENTPDQLISNINATFVTKNNTQNNFELALTAKENIITSSISLLNKDLEKLKGTLNSAVTFSKTSNNALQTDISIDAGKIVLNKSAWNINKSSIRILPNVIDIDKFIVSNPANDQKLTINGTYSTKESTNETLSLKLQNIDLAYIFSTLNISALEFQGLASGDVEVSTIEKKPYADINLKVADFGFNKTKFGNLNLKSELDPRVNIVELKGDILNSDNKSTTISGEIDPINQTLSLYFDSEEVDIAFLNKYAESLFNDIKGKGKGNVHLFGDFSNVTVEGKAFITDGELGINFLNTRYHFTDTVYLKSDLIYFNKLKLYDQFNNEAIVSGKIAHNYFSNFMYYVELNGNNFMLYNATEKLNPIFYGKVFGSGYGTIKGDESAVDLDFRLKTQKGTSVSMNFMDDVATEYSFITYKERPVSDSLTSNQTQKVVAPTPMEVNMNLYIDATPEATVEMIMDPIGGDKLRGTGSGSLQFIWGTNKDPMLYGTYLIHNGSYNFTFQKILERKFSIQEDSYVQFRGDPFQAALDVTAKYRVVANLFDLDRNLVETSGQTSIPVNCVLNLSGIVRRPEVKLDIELPSTDPEIARQIKNLINTEDMINRQVTYLLILSKFYTPNYAETDQRTNDFASLASATLSSQLGNILNKIDDRWQVGTNIRTSDSNFSSTEVELLLSSKLLNDRVIFNGNFGYRDNPLTQETFIGDVDLEVLLNPAGTWRLKAYNHYNEKFYYINNNSVQTQGVGILYKRDFNNFKDLFRRKKKDKTTIVKDTTNRKIKSDTISINTDSINYNHIIIKKDSIGSMAKIETQQPTVKDKYSFVKMKR